VKTTLGERLASRDRQRFVGRAQELAFFDRLLVEDPPASVVLVHGPGGIGKSTLLREVARRAAERGRAPRLVDARDLAPVPGELEQALDGVDADELPLVMFDTYERMTAAGTYLRQRLLPSLPERSLVILAGRAAPEPDWFQGGWERLTVELELKPMPDDDSLRLLHERGVEDDALAAELCGWSGGSPLALTLAADAARSGGGWEQGEPESSPELVRGLIRHLVSAELESAGDKRDVLAVAAIARTTTRRLLEAVLPDVGAPEAEAWLRSLSFAEYANGGIALHDVVRKAVRADVRLREPEHEKELRRRVADHLYDRALAGDTRMLVDLADLVDNKAIRWGFGAEGSVDYRVDELRFEDVELAEARTSRRAGGNDWWQIVKPLIEEAPECCVITRDSDDEMVGLCVFVTPNSAPAAAERDPVLAPWLAHARENFPDGNVILWRDSLDLTASEKGDISSRVLAIQNTAAILRCGLVNPRISYLPIDRENAAAVQFALNIGARHVPELDAVIGGKPHECHLLDHGASGIIGGQRNTVYWEMGLPTPEPDKRPSGVAPSVTHDSVKALARHLDRPLELAASPLASGSTPDERAESVRALFREAIDGAFGASADEQLLRTIAERGCLTRAVGHEALADELHLSRATYFRRLRQASERLADFIVAKVAADGLSRG
jgi:AAA ATPase domain